MPEIVYVATTNRHKLEEITALLGPLGFSVRSCAELGRVSVVEDGATFLANARKKARAYLERTDRWVLADDSGLEVAALGGAPGVRSARYAGVSGPGADEANNAKLLEELKEVPEENREARFVCTVVLGVEGKEVTAVRGTAEGRIISEPRGRNGFGYDPVFFHPPTNRTFAELPPEAKNEVSHRGRALRAVADFLRTSERGRKRLAEIRERSR